MDDDDGDVEWKITSNNNSEFQLEKKISTKVLTFQQSFLLNNTAQN